MSKSKVKTQLRSKSKDRVLSQEVSSFIKENYPQKIPIAVLSGLTKLHCRGRTLKPDDPSIKRFSDGKNVNTAKFLQYLETADHHEKGKTLSQDSIIRTYENFANPEGQLTFEYIMKMGEQTGVSITAKIAKAIVRKYGKGKNSISIDDVLNLNERRERKEAARSTSKSAKKK